VRIDLNADVGESFGRWSLGADEQLFPLVTSVNVACGFHAGDPLTIQRTVRFAAAAGLAVGAHPSYPDLAGFGRRAMQMADSDIEAMVTYQVAAVQGIARAEGIRLTHVKPHGALYNTSARDERVAAAIARAVRRLDPALALVGLAGSASIRAASEAGLRPIREGFPDRGYLRDGSLAPRGTDGAVVGNAAAAAARAVRMVREGRVTPLDSEIDLPVELDTLCIHGDSPDAPAIASAVRAALGNAGIHVVTFAAPHPLEQ